MKTLLLPILAKFRDSKFALELLVNEVIYERYFVCQVVSIII